MTKGPAHTAKWYQLIHEDDDDLSGASVAAFMETISRYLVIREVILSDLEGAIFGLREMSGKRMSWPDFIQRLPNADQYNWAFFFLFSSERHLAFEGDEETMRLADATVRLVDSGYFYVYSTDKALIDNLCATYRSAQMREFPFEMLEVPY